VSRAVSRLVLAGFVEKWLEASVQALWLGRRDEARAFWMAAFDIAIELDWLPSGAVDLDDELCPWNWGAVIGWVKELPAPRPESLTWVQR